MSRRTIFSWRGDGKEPVRIECCDAPPPSIRELPEGDRLKYWRSEARMFVMVLRNHFHDEFLDALVTEIQGGIHGDLEDQIAQLTARLEHLQQQVASTIRATFPSPPRGAIAQGLDILGEADELRAKYGDVRPREDSSDTRKL